MTRSARPAAWLGPRGIAALFALAAAAFALALFVSWPIVAVLAAVAVAGTLAADVGLVARVPTIVRVLPARFALARADRIAYTVENDGPVALRFGVLEAPVPKLEVAVEGADGRVPAGGRATVHIAFTPRERGRTQIGEAFAWYESPLGFVRRRIVVGPSAPIRVMPDLSALERGGDLARRTKLIEAGLRRVRRRGVGTEFESLREYAVGDAFRTIDWKATARRGKVMVAQYEVERSQQIVVALDAGRLMAPRLGDRRKLDYAISAALSIAAIAELSDDRVGLHAFASTTLASLAPRAGALHVAAITDVLTELQPQREESDYERAALEIRRRFRKRSLIVVFTDLFDPIASGAVLAALGLLVPHHLVLVVLMNDAAIAQALEREPHTVSDAYRAGVAAALVAERERALALLGRRGIGVIDVPARALSVALLDAYIEIKTRALL